MNPANLADVHRPLLQGHRIIAGVWFPANWYPETTRRQRIIAQWKTGANVWRFPEGDLLIYAGAFEMDCSEIEGWPVSLYGRTLCSAELEPHEIANLPHADFCLVRGGQIEALNCANATSIDASTWINISEYGLLDTYDCREILPKLEVVIDTEIRDLREVLGGVVGEASPERADFLKALQKRPPLQNQSQNNQYQQGPVEPGFSGLTIILVISFLAIILLVVISSPSGTSGNSGPPLAIIVPILFLLFQWLKPSSPTASKTNWSADPRQYSKSPAAGGKSALQRAADNLKSRRESQQPQKWREWLARIAVTTQLSKLLGRQQAAYMRKMLEMFEDGKLEDALRHAIPLGGAGSASLGQAFGTPQARDKLTLSSQLGSGTSIHLGDDLETYLRELYRKSFEKLDREKRIDEAVFVLAELLQSRQEALDYLEKHERYTQAAELALAWDRPSDVIVRLHCLAGDWQRAIAVARRDGSFANAVVMLEKKWPDAAKRLRLEWAETLALQGEWLAAIEAIWPLESERERAREWLITAEKAGGQLGAQALIKRVMLLPDTLQAHKDTLMQLRDDPDRNFERAALAKSMLALKPSERLERIVELARIFVTPILVDQASRVGQLDKKELQNLINLAGDKLLTADLPNGSLPFSQATALYTNLSRPHKPEVPAQGTHAILDAVPLDNGQFLLALGEAGAVVINRQGKALYRLALPADKLVIAASKQIALALTRRGEIWRVSRLDLAARTATDLGMIQLDYFAEQFDGIAWSVVSNNCLRVLDVSASLHKVLWQVADLPGKVIAFTANQNQEQLLIENERGRVELWRYSLPQRRLNARDAVQLSRGENQIQLLNPSSGLFDLLSGPTPNGEIKLSYQKYSVKEIVLEGSTPENTLGMRLRVNEGWLSINRPDNNGVSSWDFYLLMDALPRVHLEWPQNERVNTRHGEEYWLLFGDQGRLVHVDLVSSAIHTVSLRL